MAKHALKYISYLLITIGLLMVLRPVVHYCRWKVREIHAEQKWLKFINEEPDNQGREVPMKEIPAAWMEIPEIDLKTIVLDGADEENLLLYPCLEQSGSRFETPGIKVILGHRDMHFRRLKKLGLGSVINIQLKDRTRRTYRIKETEILMPEQVERRVAEKKSSAEDWLLLVTCYPFRYTGPAPRRFLVWCRRW